MSVHVSPNLRQVFFKNKKTKVGSPRKRELKAFPSNTSGTCNFLVYRDNKACYSLVLCHSLFQWSRTISCSVNLISIHFFLNFHSFFFLHASTEKESSYIRAYTVHTGVCVCVCVGAYKLIRTRYFTLLLSIFQHIPPRPFKGWIFSDGNGSLFVWVW